MNDHKHPQQDMIEDFEAGPMPMPGVPSNVRPTALAPQPPRLCALGPCRHYHRVRFQMDAQEPLHGSGAPLRLKTLHSCYAQVGVDTDMTDTHVFECNRYDPVDPISDAELGRANAMQRALETPDGEIFMAEMATWESERKKREIANDESDDAQLVKVMRQIFGAFDLPKHDEHKPDAECPRCRLEAEAMKELLSREDLDGLDKPDLAQESAVEDALRFAHLSPGVEPKP